MADYRKVELQQYPRTQERESSEARYWKKFAPKVLEKYHAPVSSISICPETKDYVVTTGTRVVMFDGHSHEARKAFSYFKDIAYSGSFRTDGALMAAGCEHPVVRVFDVARRSMLRQFEGHKGPIRAVRFLDDGIRVASGSDDHTVCLWDLGSGGLQRRLRAHTDYVRGVCLHPASPGVFASSSFDHTAKIWDARLPDKKACTLSVDHGEPVSNSLFLPGGQVLLTAGGSDVKAWDVSAGGRLLHTISSHNKTVMSMALDSTGTRVLTAGLDHHLKIHDVRTFEEGHGIKYSLPLLSVAVAPDNAYLAVGMADGTLSVRARVGEAQEASTVQRARQARGGTYKYFIRGQNTAPETGDAVITRQRKPKLNKFDKLLKKFQYKSALDAALQTGDVVVVVSVIQELVHRGALQVALGGRDAVTLAPTVAFLVKYIAHPRYARLLLDVTEAVLDTYTPVVGQSPLIDALFQKLHNRVREEQRLQDGLFRVSGMLDSLFAAADNAALRLERVHRGDTTLTARLSYSILPAPIFAEPEARRAADAEEKEEKEDARPPAAKRARPAEVEVVSNGAVRVARAKASAGANGEEGSEKRTGKSAASKGKKKKKEEEEDSEEEEDDEDSDDDDDDDDDDEESDDDHEEEEEEEEEEETVGKQKGTTPPARRTRAAQRQRQQQPSGQDRRASVAGAPTSAAKRRRTAARAAPATAAPAARARSRRPRG